jgi:hypothetical protein
MEARSSSAAVDQFRRRIPQQERFPMLKAGLWKVLAIVVVIFGCNDQPSAGPLTSIHLTMVSGDSQTSVSDSFLPSPLTVQVVNDQKIGVPDVRIEWRVTAGAGDLLTFPARAPLTNGYSVTDSYGVASVVFRPVKYGISQVAASAPTIVGKQVVFTTMVTPPVEEDPLPSLIKFGPMFDCTGTSDPYLFEPEAPVVALGVPVEWWFMDWVYPPCTAHLKSISEPPNGLPFESGIMSPGRKFRFLPNVTGTWVYIDVASGGKGRFTVVQLP